MGCSNSAQTANNPAEPKQKENFHDKYELGAKLGKGAFAQVHLATEVGSKDVWAVKIIDLESIVKNPEPGQGPKVVDVKKTKQAQHEVAIHRKTSGDTNIVTLADAFLEFRVAYFVMEKCSMGLWEMLDSAPEVNENLLGKVFRGMIAGIAYCHSQKVVHRDIKPDNFLVGNLQKIEVKLCDFGLAEVLPENKLLVGVYGTAPFMAPEMLTGKGYNEKVDIWSFAVIVYVLLFGQFPYVPKGQTSSDMKTAISEGIPEPSFKTNVKCTNAEGPSQAAHDFVKAILVREYRDRLSAQDTIACPWMVDMEDSSKSARGASFRPMMYMAKRVGAFEQRNLHKESGLDSFLNEMQMKHLGKPLVSAPPRREEYRSPSKEQLKKAAKLQRADSKRDFISTDEISTTSGSVSDIHSCAWSRSVSNSTGMRTTSNHKL